VLFAVVAWIVVSLFLPEHGKREQNEEAKREYIQHSFDYIWGENFDTTRGVKEEWRALYFEKSLKGKWVSWTGTIESIQATADSYLIGMKLSRNKTFFDDATIEFLPRYRERLSEVKKGDEMDFMAQFAGFSTYGFRMSSGEITDVRTQ